MAARKTAKTNKAMTRKAAKKKAPAPASATKTAIYQIKVTLRDFKPFVWRRIQVRSDATLGELHAIIQMAIGWSNSHLHHFIVGKRPNLRFIGFGNEDGDFDMGGEENENKVMISAVLPTAKTNMVYEYD